MNNFEFYNPVRIIFGPGEISRTGKEAAQRGKKVMVVSYADHRALDAVLDKVVSLLKAENLSVVTFFEISPNPLLSQVRTGIQKCKSEGVDLIIGVGGGSSMDASKLIAAGVFYDGDVWDMVYSRHDNITAVTPTKSLPKIMVPTLPATSSEMNRTAVVTNDETHEKSYAFGDALYADVSIIDPELTCTLPKYQTAIGVADAISHGLETYFNAADDTPLQHYMVEGVVLTLMESVRKVLVNLNDVNNRTILQWAACVAWNEWTNTGSSHFCPMHQLGHVMSARFNVPHGATLSIIMPAWMKYTYKQNQERFVLFAERIFGVDSKGKKAEDVALEGIKRFEKFLQEIGAPTKLSEVNIPADAIDSLTDDVMRISALANGTVDGRPPINREGVKSVYELAF